MRSDLFTHPKVVRMSSALKADTLRTVGGLMSVWCLFDVHSVDGKLDGYTFGTIDDHLRWEGFSSAMGAVGWLEQVSDGLVLPRFDTHNGQSAKRRANDADRKREVRKASASDADKKRTREEKRREEINTPPLRLATPDGVSAELWESFLKLRKAKRAPMSELALAGIKKEADAAGWTLSEALSESVTRGWQSFKAEWVTGKDAGGSSGMFAGAI